MNSETTLKIWAKIVQTEPHNKQEVIFLTKWGTSLLWIKILLQVLCAKSEFTKSANATKIWEGEKVLFFPQECEMWLCRKGAL